MCVCLHTDALGQIILIVRVCSCGVRCVPSGPEDQQESRSRPGSWVCSLPCAICFVAWMSRDVALMT